MVHRTVTSLKREAFFATGPKVHNLFMTYVYKIFTSCHTILFREEQQIHTAMNNNMISEESLEIEMAEEKIHAAMTKLADDLTAAYKEACRFAPELVEKESDPRWFLR